MKWREGTSVSKNLVFARRNFLRSWGLDWVFGLAFGLSLFLIGDVGSYCGTLVLVGLLGPGIFFVKLVGLVVFCLDFGVGFWGWFRL